MIIPVIYTIYSMPYAYGSGFIIDTQGASSLAQGAATIAHTDYASAIYFNPALINKLEGTQVELGTTLLFPSSKFKSDITGKTFKIERDVFYPSTFYLTHKINDKVSAGLGVFNPFGLRTKWSENWEGRYIITNSEMQTYNINPVVSYQITPYIAVAAGLDFLLLDATLERKINMLFFGIPNDGNQKFEGDGTGVGYNLGILFEPHKNISIGASYRSEIKVDIDGDATFDLPSGTPSLIGALFPDTRGNTDITLPQQTYLGIYYKGFDPLTFEVALRWEGWSSYDRLKIKVDKPVLGKKTPLDEKKDWEDTYSVNIGAKYQLNDSVAFLAGYLYGGNPIPDKTFDPTIPDAKTYQLSIGTDIKYKKLRFALAYAYQKWQSRNKSNSIDDTPDDGFFNSATSANGDYNSDLHVIGITLNYRF